MNYLSPPDRSPVAVGCPIRDEGDIVVEFFDEGLSRRWSWSERPAAAALLAAAESGHREFDAIVVGEYERAFYGDQFQAVVARLAAVGVQVWLPEAWASSDEGGEPDVVLACAGDVPTVEILAATSLLRQHLPQLRVRVVNVVDLMRLQPDTEHPHGMTDAAFDALFTTDKPVIFAYHGYPWLIHRLTYRRTNHHNLHVRGYKEEGTTTTPFDMLVRNDMDRFQLVVDVIDRVPGLGTRAAHVRQHMQDQRARRGHARGQGLDLAARLINAIRGGGGGTSPPRPLASTATSFGECDDLVPQDLHQLAGRHENLVRN